MLVLNRARLAAIALGLSTVGGAFGCDAGLTSGTAYEAPLFEFHALVWPAGALPVGAHLLMGVIWSDPLQIRPDVQMPARWINATPSDISDEALTIRIFRPPPPEALVEITNRVGDRAQLALGTVVMVDDRDGDGTFQISGPRAEITAPDAYLAGTFQSLVYVAHPFSSTTQGFPIVPSSATGYQLVDYACSGRISNATSAIGESTFRVQPGRYLPEPRNCLRTHSP